MKKLYISGNYIIYENGVGGVLEYPRAFTVYTLSGTDYKIVEQSGIGVGTLTIPSSDITNIFDEEGVTPFDELTFLSFLRDNTGFKSGGGNGIFGVTLNVNTLKEISASNGKLIYVEEFNNLFVYSEALQDWQQVGENNILREGLISGSLYVNKIKAG